MKRYIYYAVCGVCVCQSSQLWMCAHSARSIFILHLSPSVALSLSVACSWSVLPVLHKSNRNVAAAIQLQPYKFIAYVFRLRYFMRSGKGIACGFNLQRFKMHEDCRTKIWYTHCMRTHTHHRRHHLLRHRRRSACVWIICTPHTHQHTRSHTHYAQTESNRCK